jgi:hypothetical protein
VLTTLGQPHGSSQKTLPTSGRTTLETDDTSMAHSQHSMVQENHSGSNMDEKTLGIPHGATVSPVSDLEHVETDAEK